MKYLLLLLLCGCSLLPIKSGNHIASEQDKLIRKIGETLTKDEWEFLYTTNVEPYFPGNLHIRQLCLQDIFMNKESNKREILNEYRLLTDGIWLEGYSYWKYTRLALDQWVNINSNYSLQGNIDTIENNFSKLSYYSGGFKPVPYGDVRNELINKAYPVANIKVGPITKLTSPSADTIIYITQGAPRGLNTHIPNNDDTVLVINGTINYKWYQGYDKKYKTKADMVEDYMDRIFK